MNSDNGDHKNSQNQNQSQNQTQGSKAVVIPEQKQNPSGTEHDRNSNGHKDGYSQPFLNRFSVVASIFLGLALVIVGLLQFLVYSRQAKIMRAQTHISDQANLLTESIQRAFVGVSQFEIDHRQSYFKNDNTIYWWFTPIIENSGSTPTNNLSYYLVADVCVNPMGLGAHQAINCNFATQGKEPEDPEDSLRQLRSQNMVGRTVIAPHAKLALGGIGLPSDAISQMKQRKESPFYFSGLINYEDTLRNGDMHITKFCYHIIENTSETGGVTPGYELCQHWNCADKECAGDRKRWEEEQQPSGLQKRPQ
jgi:hypothetical protein